MGSKWTKLLTAAIVVAMALAPAGEAVAKKKKKKPKPPEPIVRVDTFDYTAPGGVRANGSDGNVCAEGTGCTTFDAASGELYVTVEVADKSDTPTPFVVTINGVKTEYCGTTGGPITLDGATEVSVNVEAVIPGKCQAVGTQGAITATFTNLLEAPAA